MGKKIGKRRGISLTTRLGIFSIVSLVAITALYFYSPVIVSTHADDNAGTTAGAWVETVASVTADAQVILNITPTESGAFTSQPINVRARSNTAAGYKLFISSVDNSTDMTSTSSSDVIASDFSGTKTSETIGANKWGYSTNNTDFSAIPTLSNQVAIVDTTSSVPDQETSTTVYIGAKVNSALKAGAYTKNIIFSVVAYQSPKTIFDITYMQEMDKSVCDATTTPDIADPANNYYPYQTTHVNTDDTSKIPETTLIDSRDDKTYLVRKYANGECWMAQNLELDFKTQSDGFANDMTVASGNTLANAVTTPVKTATFSEDWIEKSDITNRAVFNLASNAITSNKFYATQSVPVVQGTNDTTLGWGDVGHDGAHSFSTNASGLANYIVYNCTDNTRPCDDTTNPHITAGSGGYYTFRESTTGEPYQRVGNYYNFAAATAGFLGDGTDDQPNSICPRGWQLPANSGARSFKNLIDKYYVEGEGRSYSDGSYNTTLYNWLNGAPLDFWRTGVYNRSNGVVKYRTTHGHWWGMKPSSSQTGKYLNTYIDNNTTYIYTQSSSYRGNGYNIRCVVRG